MRPSVKKILVFTILHNYMCPTIKLIPSFEQCCYIHIHCIKLITYWNNAWVVYTIELVQRDIRYGVWADTLPYRFPAPESLFSQYMATMPYLLHGGECKKAHMIANLPSTESLPSFQVVGQLDFNVHATIMFVIQLFLRASFNEECHHYCITHVDSKTSGPVHYRDWVCAQKSPLT